VDALRINIYVVMVPLRLRLDQTLKQFVQFCRLFSDAFSIDAMCRRFASRYR
jgi:hypothetical protein